MYRINCYSDDPDGFAETRTLAGWYDADKATSYDEDTRWDGNNHISLATGTQWGHERLDRTAGGRWAIYSWSQWQGVSPSARFVTAEQAKEWMIRNDYSAEAITEATGIDMEDERGPGRPEIGPPIQVRLPADLLGALDTQRGDLSRAEAVRRAVTAWTTKGS